MNRLGGEFVGDHLGFAESFWGERGVAPALEDAVDVVLALSAHMLVDG